MSCDWRPGDLALCVAPEGNVVSGGVYTVVDAFFGYDGESEGWALELEEAPPCQINGQWYEGYDAWRFRKIRPLTDEERASFLADLDAPLFAPEPSEVAPVGAALNERAGHLLYPRP